MTGNPLTADQVARRLGVQRATVYAYVSRGLLSRAVAPDGRTSHFDPDEVEVLARRGRPRRATTRTGTVDVVLTSAITHIDGGRLVHRGADLAEIAPEGFERLAERLWDDPDPPPVPWTVPPESIAVAGRATAALPPGAPPASRLAVAVASLAAADAGRGDLRPEALRAKARIVLGTVATVPPLVGDDDRPADQHRTVAARLWPRLSPLVPTPDRLELLDRGLTALADHELATSTLAARVAASTRANPYACLLAAIGAVSGPLHGRAAVLTHRLLGDAVASGRPEAVVASAIDDHGRVPGFGHPLYDGIDPRAELLLPLVVAGSTDEVARAVDGVRAATLAATGAEPDVDFALAALALASDMAPGATEVVFVTARMAGWVAHVMEEYAERPLRFRPRSIYTGPDPGPPDGFSPGR